MRISVVVPLYNKAKFVARSIDSILNQTFADFELIIVNDGSTDDSAAVVSAYTDSRITLLTQKNQGPGAARNTGIRTARGELIAFLDADDEWFPNYLEESIALFDSASAGTSTVVSGYVEFPSAKSPEMMWRSRGIENEEVELKSEPATSARLDPMKVVHRLAYMSSWSTVVKKATLEKYGAFFAENRCTYGEDAHLFLKILLNERVRFSLMPLVKFHREASELSKNDAGPRPIEPFLKSPGLLRDAAPQNLRRVLDQVLAIRAYKTSCMLGFWGDWRSARGIFTTFQPEHAFTLPYYLPAAVCSTPVGPLIAFTWRKVRELKRQQKGKNSTYDNNTKSSQFGASSQSPSSLEKNSDGLKMQAIDSTSISSQFTVSESFQSSPCFSQINETNKPISRSMHGSEIGPTKTKFRGDVS